jgi:hypothetical protein
MKRQKKSKAKGFYIEEEFECLCLLKVLSFSTTRNTSKNISNKTKKRKEMVIFNFL